MSMTTTEREEWRRIFTDTIINLTGGNADVLQIASWALQAQHEHGDQDAQQVARDEFKSGKPPTPD
jgi:hypothetical protein